MNQCKIISIKPDGKPWDSQYGRMYPFYVVFEDGAAGTTNSKSETPPYKVGDEVGYDITGATPKGVPKLKITRNPKPGEATHTGGGATHPDLEAARPQNPPQNRSSGPAHTQSPSKGLEHYTALYSACIGAARKTCSDASFADDAETVRQIATAFFIQGLRDGITVDPSVPF